jgi:serine protease AprX
MLLAGINAHSVHAHDQVEGGKHYSPNARHSNYLLVQFNAPLDHNRYSEIHRLKLYTLEYLAGNTFLCYYEPEDLDVLRNLPFVVYANVYHPEYVVQSDLKSKIDKDLQSTSADTLPTHHVSITLHSLALIDQAKTHIADILHVAESTLGFNGTSLTIHLNSQQISTVAALDEVLSVEELRPLEYKLFKARQDIGLPSKSGGRFGSALFKTYRGQGQVIAIADAGINGGYIKKPNPFGDDSLVKLGNDHPAFTGRLLDRVALVRQRRIVDVALAKGDESIVTALRTNDSPNSHGTHVAGCALGNDFSIFYGTIQGPAPRASLIMYSLDTWDYEIDKDIDVKDMLNQAYTHAQEPRIHNNSYGPTFVNDPPGGYDRNRAQAADEYIWGHQDLLVIVAAGNDGTKATQYSQMEEMSIAKNVLTVGACQSSHPLRWGRLNNMANAHLRYQPGFADGNPDSVGYFSSRGPAYTRNPAGDQAPFRWKPDVVAPGVAILSAQARGRPGTGKKFGFSLSPDYFFSSGTSMAAPMVAGAAALVRQAVLQRRADRPVTAALLKALLINTTDDIRTPLRPAPPPNPLAAPAPARAPVQAQPPGPIPFVRHDPPPVNPAPDGAQGFGRINVPRALQNVTDDVMAFFDDNCIITAISPGEGSSRTFSPPIPAHGTSTLSVTMCYTDLPGQALSHILSLEVTTGGVTRFGNDMAVQGGWALPRNQPDTANNVQKVVWQDIPANADVQVRVWCSQLVQRRLPPTAPPDPDLNFAIAWMVTTREHAF